MKILCVYNQGGSLTIGKWYDCDDFDKFHDLYHIINDKGVEWAYNKHQFKTIDQLREEKLNELGI